MKILNENVSKNIMNILNESTAKRTLNEASETTQAIDNILQNLANSVIDAYNKLKKINTTNNNGIDDITQEELNRILETIEDFMHNMDNENS